jgi:concentrative nucleoside transporter, CNT family
MEILRSLAGLLFFIGIAWLFSADRKHIDWKLVGVGLLLQLLFGWLVIKVPVVSAAFNYISSGFVTFLDFSLAGSAFLFGDLAKNSDSISGTKHQLGFIFAFQVLPTVIFFSTVSAGLYYLGILQKVVYGIAWVMSRTMKLSGPESLSAAGNIFLGQTEAPLLVKPYIKNMTRSELLCLMTGGMATIAGGVLAAYVSFLGGNDPVQKTLFAASLLSASVMNAPAGIVFAKILYPERDRSRLNNNLQIAEDKIGVNLIDAMSRGAADGLKLALNVGGMLLAFIAVIAMLNYLLQDVIGELTGLNTWIEAQTKGRFSGLSLQYILGQIFRVFALAMGIDWSESLAVGSLLGQKTAINEFVAYLDLAKLKASGQLSERSVILATYALCGFSNFSSIAIQLGGIGSMAPEKQSELSILGFRALFAASLACMVTATVAGLYL